MTGNRFHFPQQTHGTVMDPSSIYLQTLPSDSKSTVEAFSEAVIDSNIMNQYSNGGLAECVNCGAHSAANASSSCSVPDTHSSSATLHLNLPAPNQYYSNGECYSDLQQYACMSSSADSGALPSYAPQCINSQSALGYHQSVGGGYQAHANHNALQAGYQGSSHSQLSASDDYAAHQNTVAAEYQSATPDNLEDIAFSGSLPQQQLQSSDGSGDSVKSKRVKVDIGIQCEVGPETLQALLEDEDLDSVKEVGEHSQSNKRKPGSLLRCRVYRNSSMQS